MVVASHALCCVHNTTFKSYSSTTPEVCAIYFQNSCGFPGKTLTKGVLNMHICKHLLHNICSGSTRGLRESKRAFEVSCQHVNRDNFLDSWNGERVNSENARWYTMGWRPQRPKMCGHLMDTSVWWYLDPKYENKSTFDWLTSSNRGQIAICVLLCWTSHKFGCAHEPPLL